MRVNVVFTTQLKAAIGQASQDIELADNASVHEAIAAVAEQHAEAFSKYVLHDGQLMPSILLSVNDHQAQSDAKLADGDTLTLLSAISGG